MSDNYRVLYSAVQHHFIASHAEELGTRLEDGMMNKASLWSRFSHWMTTPQRDRSEPLLATLDYGLQAPSAPPAPDHEPAAAAEPWASRT